MNTTHEDLAPTDLARRAALAAAGALVVGGVGCATAMVLNGTPDTTTREGPVVLNDTVVALGRPDAALARQLDSPEAIVFFGKTHTYLLVEGGPALEQIARRLAAGRLTLVPDSHALYLQERTVWGDLQLRYVAPDGGTFSAREIEALAELRFHSAPDGSQRANITVKGALHPALTVPPQAQALRHSRELVFHAPPVTEKRPAVGNALAVPLAVALDVVTAPLQLLGFAVVLVLVATSR